MQQRGWLGLCHGTRIPQRDVRKLIWCLALLSSFDCSLIRAAHNFHFSPILDLEFAHYCAMNGYIHILQWSLNPQMTRAYKTPLDAYVCTLAAEYGHLDVLQWARAQVPPIPWDRWTPAYAAYSGHLEVLKWARAQVPPVPWDGWTCTLAASGGYLEVLKWARAQVPPAPWDGFTCSMAADNGHLAVLQWARENGCPE